MGGGGGATTQDDNQSGGKWRIKTLTKLGNVLSGSSSHEVSSDQDRYWDSSEVDPEDYVSSVSFRDEIICKIASGRNVIENCKLLEDYENGDGEGEGTLRAKEAHSNTTAKRRKKRPKLKSALRSQSQFEASGPGEMDSDSQASTEAPSSVKDSSEEKKIRRLEREQRLKRHDGQGPLIASLLSSPLASPTKSPSPQLQDTSASSPDLDYLTTPSGKLLAIELNSEDDESQAVELARKMQGAVIPLVAECSCKDCQAKIEIGLAENYEPPWSKPARLKYIAGREQAKILALQRMDAAKRLAQKAEKEDQYASFHSLGGNGLGPTLPSWASPNTQLSPAGSRSVTPSNGDASGFSQKQKEPSLSTIALARAAQLNGQEAESQAEGLNQKSSSDNEAELLAASIGIGLKMELENDRIDSNKTPDIEGPRPIRSSLDLIRPGDDEEEESTCEGLRPPTFQNSSTPSLTSSGEHSPVSEQASDAGPSIIPPSPMRSTSGSFSSPSTSSQKGLPPVSPEAELPPLISNPIDDELVDELRALRLKAEEAARHRAASPRIRGGGARAMMRQLEAAESRESVASIERTRSANSNRRYANVSSESQASSGWGGPSPSPSPRGWEGSGSGMGRIGSPPIRAWSPYGDPTSPVPIARTLSPPFIHRTTSPPTPSSPMMRGSPLARNSSDPEAVWSLSNNQVNQQQEHCHGPGGHSLLRTCQEAASDEPHTRAPLIIQRPKARPASAVFEPKEDADDKMKSTDASLPAVSVTSPSTFQEPVGAFGNPLELKEESTSGGGMMSSTSQERVADKADILPPQKRQHQHQRSSSSNSSSLYQAHSLLSAFGTPLTASTSVESTNSPQLHRSASSDRRSQPVRPKPLRTSSQNAISKKDNPSPPSQEPSYVPSAHSNPPTSTVKRGMSFLKSRFT